MDNYLVLLIIIIFIISAIIVIASTKKINSFLDRLTNKFPLLSGFFIAFGVFITYRIFKLNHENTLKENTLRMIDRGWVSLNEKIIDYYSQCPAFIDTLYYDWQKKALLNLDDSSDLQLKLNNVPNQDKWNCINAICVLIFQSIEDFITIHESGMSTSDHVWIANFLQFLKSERVQEIWGHFKANYDNKTILLIDYLIEVSINNIPKNEQEFEKITDEIAKSQRYKDIMKA
jgi:hypothetical protein